MVNAEDNGKLYIGADASMQVHRGLELGTFNTLISTLTVVPDLLAVSSLNNEILRGCDDLLNREMERDTELDIRLDFFRN